MSDGVTLGVNVFRPDHVAPMVMSMTPYGEDNTPDRIGMLAMRIRTSCWPLVRWIATSRAPWMA
jgi:predicted acyl esterase